MRGRDIAEQERADAARASPLTALVGHLGRDPVAWLQTALAPLPETFRISLHRTDRSWTVEQVKAFGAKALPWMAEETAFAMPFERGKATGDAGRMMALLHETGRITRQEAASMLPVRLLDDDANRLILDLCAAPGSKTTQVAEKLHPDGVVIANEPVSGRLNMLVSNRSRLGLANVVVTQHDGRHFARLPPPGVDAVLADVPCTGTATTRKNRDVWWQWTPKEGRKMFTMQVEIASRGAALLVPGGELIYSTCSVDPIENEAVVAELLRRHPFLEVETVEIPGLTLHQGLNQWPLLNEDGTRCDDDVAEELPFFADHHRSPVDRLRRGLGVKETEERIAEALLGCGRLWHEDHNTGGFFVAKLRYRADASPEGTAAAYRSRRAVRNSTDWTPPLKRLPPVTVNTVVEADHEVLNTVETLYGMDLSPFSVWQRGKRLNVAPPLVKQRLFDPPSPTNKGDVWPGGSFHPMRVAHVGLPAFTLKKDSWRSRQEAVYVLRDKFTANITDITEDVFVRLLCGWAPLLDEFESETGLNNLPSGAFLFTSEVPCGVEVLSVWLGARVTLMVDLNEQNILRRKLGLPWRDEEETA